MEKMPLLDHVKSLHPLSSLSNVLLIGCQHILATTHLMLRSLYDCGLNPKNIYLLGKCYSSNVDVLDEMREDSINVSPLSLSFESQQPFDLQYSHAVKQFLKNITSKLDLSKFEKIILLDDGGQLLFHARKFLKEHKNVIGIEQTSSGFDKIKSISIPFPVVNVARCDAKLIYESPFIAQTVIEKSFNRISRLNLHPEKILIIGGGAIGSAIYKSLKDSYQVRIYDRNSTILKSNADAVNLTDLIHEADLIIGCTGKTSLSFSNYQYLKNGCILISASSSDREFDAVFFRRKANIIKSCHDDLEVEGVTLLNCGFPINFDGSRHSVAPKKIQLTRALLLTAILQACEISDEMIPQIIPLDIEAQRDIITKFLQLYPESIPNNIQQQVNMEIKC